MFFKNLSKSCRSFFSKFYKQIIYEIYMKRRQINKINQAYFWFSKKKELMQSSKTTKKRINAIFKNKTKELMQSSKMKKSFSKDTGILSKTRRLVQYPKISLPLLYNPSETGWHIITSQWRGNLYLRYCVGIYKNSQRVHRIELILILILLLYIVIYDVKVGIYDT